MDTENVVLGYMARDQFGETIHLKTKHPRKELMDHYGTQHAAKMFRDCKSGGVRHVGYIVAGHWFNVYRVLPFQEHKEGWRPRAGWAPSKRLAPVSENGAGLGAVKRGERMKPPRIPKTFAVQPLNPRQVKSAIDPATCGTCGLTWDDGIITSWTPAPAARCPFEHYHKAKRGNG
jgi:hypothetical protein